MYEIVFSASVSFSVSVSHIYVNTLYEMEMIKKIHKFTQINSTDIRILYACWLWFVPLDIHVFVCVWLFFKFKKISAESFYQQNILIWNW